MDNKQEAVLTKSSLTCSKCGHVYKSLADFWINAEKHKCIGKEGNEKSDAKTTRSA